MRKHYPRWQGENFEKNLELVTRVEALAEKNGCTPGQVAISWLVSLNKRPGMPRIIPVAGATKPGWIKENAKVIDLPAEDIAAIDKILASFQSQGERYPKMFMDHLDL
jgi:pyridoxine 4-dehydrogenase